MSIMQRHHRLTGIGGIIALALVFLGVVMLSNVLIRGARVDLTQNRLYTLSPGTSQVVKQLKEPVNLYYYFSREAAGKQAPLLLPYANRVRDLLQEIAARAGGKINLREIDAQPFSDEEDKANELGLQSLTPNGDALYFGLAGTNSTDGRSVIPNFQPEREQFLEYDIAKLLNELATPKKPVIGLLSSLPLMGRFDPQTGQMGESWTVISQLETLFNVRALTPDSAQIDQDVDVLMLVHPKNLAPKALYAVDQFVMRGGRLLLFLDPSSGADTSGQDPQNPMAAMMADHASNLEPLLSAWGVAYNANQAIGDADLGLEVRSRTDSQPVRHIGILGLRRANMAAGDVVTASLDSINVANSGYLSPKTGAKSKFEPLLFSSANAEPLPAERFSAMTDPASLRDGFKATGRRYALAARVTGNVASAYPTGSPDKGVPTAASVDKANAAPAPHLSVSKAPVNIIIVADTDLLSDFMWVQAREIFGQKVAQAFASNGDFVANALDNLGGSGALISIRGRASFSRPFTRVETLKRKADDRLRVRAQELESELRQTEARLTDLQAKRNDRSSLQLTPEQEAELRRFTAEKTRARKALRETQRGLDVDIERLNAWLKALNIAAMPLLVAIAGVVILGRRRRNAKQAA